MTENLQIWNRFADIDPKFTKPITGKDYTGTSPNPQYVIRCLTELFGPVGQGFGWRVLAENFEPMGDTTLHWCRIEFWHTDRANTFEAYGQTKAAFVTKQGFHRVDEDAPKKSLTDAIIKAASQIGIASNIFLGRWDDQKYVASVRDEYEQASKPAAPNAAAKEAPQNIAPPAPDAAEAIENAKTAIYDCTSVDQLGAVYKGLPEWLRKNADVKAATEAQKVKLTNADLGDDTIPF